MSTILVIEDDPRIQRALERQFSAEGYKVELASDGDQGTTLCKSLRPTAVVLDLMLPGKSGREVCRELKSSYADLPVVVLSAVTDVVDKVLMLELGADDYVTKPFSPRELQARVQAAVRRSRKSTPADVVAFGNITADFVRMEVRKGGELVPMTAHEIKLLKYFVENPEKVISREKLLTDVWGYHSYPTTRTVDNQILKLRQKLEPDPAHPHHFRTMHGIGYKFVSGN